MGNTRRRFPSGPTGFSTETKHNILSRSLDATRMKLLSWGISEALEAGNPTRAIQLVADHFRIPLPHKIVDERTPRNRENFPREWISVRIYHTSNIYVVSHRNDGFVEDISRYGWLSVPRGTVW